MSQEVFAACAEQIGKDWSRVRVAARRAEHAYEVIELLVECVELLLQRVDSIDQRLVDEDLGERDPGIVPRVDEISAEAPRLGREHFVAENLAHARSLLAQLREVKRGGA
jgi:hypothetical protein